MRNLLSIRKKKTTLITVFLMIAFLTNCFIVSVTSVQPPIVATTYYLQRINQPYRLDPARAWDEASRELLQNIYEPLIWWNDKHPITFTPGVGYNLTTADYADLDSYEPVLCTEVPSIANGRVIVNATGSYWRFTVNASARFQPWTDHSGVVHPARAITASDIVYSFRRQVAYDSPYGPTWMWMLPAFGTVSWSITYTGLYDTYTNGTFKHVADEAVAGVQISNWCWLIDNDVYFHLQFPWAESVQKQIFAQTWGGVVNPDWVKEMGGWDGLFTTGASDANMVAGWTNNYHWKPTDSRSELDTYKQPSRFPGHGSAYPSFSFKACGSGQYMLTSLDSFNKMWRIDYDPAYWRGWTRAGDKAGNYIHTVIEKGVSYWPTVKMLFLEGEMDEIEVPRPYMYDLLATTYNPLTGINLVYNIATLRNEAVLFTMNVSTLSLYTAYLGYPTHIKSAPDLFANEHVRKAFAWALNYTEYIQRAYFGEAIKQASFTTDTPAVGIRDLNYVQMQNELNLAVVSGYNVGSAGFETTLLYNTGDVARMIALQMIRTAFQTLNSKYKVNVMNLDWAQFLDAMNLMIMPGYTQGKLADFTDPMDFAMAYMYSGITFPNSQGPPFPTDQTAIDTGLISGTATISQLQDMYFNDTISFGLVRPIDRRWTRDWVQGWYYNALLPGDYFCDLYKATQSTQNVDLGVLIAPATPIYTTVLLCPQSGYLIIGNGNSAPANQSYLITVAYNFGPIPILLVAVGLKITGPKGETYYTDSRAYVLAPGMVLTGTFWWNGTDPGPIYGNSTGVPWKVSAETWPINGNAQDSNPSNNNMMDGTVVIKTLPGDITNNGIVDIFDAIRLSNAFGTSPGSNRWDPAADINGSGTVDIFDAILLAGNFNKHVP